MAWERQFLESKTCLLWPYCACHYNIVKWQEARADDERIFTPEELSWAEDVIYISVACAASHCPKRKIKRYCIEQLANLTQRRARIAKALEEARIN
jgi:hypothetical protein